MLMTVVSVTRLPAADAGIFWSLFIWALYKKGGQFPDRLF
jgi:hypothetical protein